MNIDDLNLYLAAYENKLITAISVFLNRNVTINEINERFIVSITNSALFSRNLLLDQYKCYLELNKLKETLYET